MKLSQANVGQSVILARCRAPYAQGQRATVERVVKRRRVVRVRIETGPEAGTSYDADVANVDCAGCDGSGVFEVLDDGTKVACIGCVRHVDVKGGAA